MIVFNLQCRDGHGFEAWFKDAKAFEAQRRARKIVCPVCGEARVDKIPTAPRIGKGVAGDHEAAAKVRASEYMKALHRLHRQVEENCDYVGDRFAEEARLIHYGEIEERGIYGEATNEEAEALHDEGVPFTAIPWPRRKDA